MISVIMTYYNTPLDQLSCAVQSVMAQRYKDIEFIIVDDGNESNPIIDDYLHNFITQWEYQRGKTLQIVHNEENKGHSESRNIGMDTSHGDCLYFIDADDYMLDNTLLVLDQNMKGLKADISIGNFTRNVFEDNPIPEMKRYDKYQAISAICMYNDSPYLISRIPQVALNATWNKLYKREVLEGIRFPTGRVRDDNATTHAIFWNCNKIIFTSLQTYYYRLGGNLAGEHLYENKDLIFAHRDRLQFLQDNWGDENVINHEKAWYLRTLLMTYLKIHDVDILSEMQQFIDDNANLDKAVQCHKTMEYAKKVITSDLIH